MAKKISVLIVALALCSTLWHPAWAAPREFSRFKVDVPDGWTAAEAGNTVNMTANDGSSFVSISLDSLQGKMMEEAAKACAGRLNGSPPRFDSYVDGYIFTFKNEKGLDATAVVIGGDNEYFLVTMAGAKQARLDGILSSLIGK
ncbi:MAG: hypothetical protein LBS31_07380 [Candidatus Adiutrix sp.]|jgi:hypothetical protein|nr:hypothetical protein [Candidatus Adiutrix sp.]